MMDDDILYPKGKNPLTPKDVDITPKEKPIPNGCKRYYYNKTGICSKSESEIYFDAIKPSNAKKKFEKFKKKYNF